MRAWLLLFLLTAASLLSGCEAIRTVFEAGLWVGVIGALILVGVIWLVMSLLRR